MPLYDGHFISSLQQKYFIVCKCLGKVLCVVIAKVDKLFQVLGKIGTVQAILDSGDLRVKYSAGTVWTIGPEAVAKVIQFNTSLVATTGSMIEGNDCRS